MPPKSVPTHRWDSRLRPPPPASPPVRRAHATTEPTRGQLRSRSWRRSSQGLYVPAVAEWTPGQRVVEASALLPLSGGGAVSGWAAAYWLGVRLLDGLDARLRREPVLLNLGPQGQLRPRPDIRLSRERFDDRERHIVRGVPCANPVRAAFDGARVAASLTAAVVIIDMIVTSGLLTLDELTAYVDQRAGWKGVQQARRAVRLAVTGSRSPPETRLRLAWVLDARLPPLLVNAAVFDLTGRLLGYPDALDPSSGVVLEYDGDDHRDISNHTRDNIREELFEAHGLTVMRATRLDLGGSRVELVRRMRQAHTRALNRDRRQDGWAIRAPRTPSRTTGDTGLGGGGGGGSGEQKREKKQK
ncbi:MAG: hypothetical protein ACR2LE_08905, partial [Nocardioidaceae bacterium]